MPYSAGPVRWRIPECQDSCDFFYRRRRGRRMGRPPPPRDNRFETGNNSEAHSAAEPRSGGDQLHSPGDTPDRADHTNRDRGWIALGVLLTTHPRAPRKAITSSATARTQNPSTPILKNAYHADDSARGQHVVNSGTTSPSLSSATHEPWQPSSTNQATHQQR